jgi:aminopeptidase N
MTVADKYHAISNMPVKSTSKSVGTNIYTFEKTVKMSTYLVAFVVSDFESISANTKNGVKVSVYTQVGDSHLGKYALEVAVPILEYYQKTYGIDFPLPKLDMIAIPDFSAGAMENWGLVTYRDTALLYDEKISTAANKERVATVVGHELAHQWFGNLVTMKWWNDLWLNEGFAAFMEYKSVDSVEGKWEMMDNFIPNSLVKALSADESRYTHSIAADVKNPSEISELFDDITYGKGSSVLRMLEAWMNEKYGDKMFFEKIHGYLSKHAYGNAETKDLWDALRTEDQNVGEFMKTWTDQAGFPFLQFNAPKQNSVVVKQERFLFSHLLAGDYPVMEEQVWSIPLSYAIYSNSTGRPKVFDRGFTQIEKLGDVKVDFKKAFPKDSILLANFAQTGVYRSLYDERSYLYLVDWLRDDLEILPAVERSGLISDVLSMTFSGRLQNPIISMEFLKLLGDDDSIFVWESMMRDLTKLKGIFALTGTYGSMVNFQTSILEKVINSVGWVETHTIGNLQGRALLRAKILSEAVSNNHKPTVAKALGFFQLIKQGRKNEVLVSADVMGAIYDAGVIYGDLNDYKYVLSSFQNSTFAPDQQMYLHALASSSVPYLQTKTLNWAISGDVRKQDIQGVLHRVSVSTPVGHLTTWIFMMENWERITKMFDKAGGFGKFNKLLEDVCGSFTQQYLINEAERLFIKQTEEGFYIPNGAELAVKKGLETAKQFLAFRAIYGPKVSYWLEEEGY